MSPAEMHQPQHQVPPAPQQLPEQQQAYQPNPAYAATPAPSYSAAPTPLYPAAAPVPQQHYIPPPQPTYAAAQPTYAHSPAPEPPASATATGPIAVMTKEQQKFGVSLLRTLRKNRSAPPFLRPVDPVALLIPDYFRVVTRPMDLGTVEQKLSATGKAITAAAKANKTFGLDYTNGTGAWEGASDKVYRTAEDFKEDVERIWENCFKYNGPREKNPVSAMAGAMQDVYERMWRTIPAAPAIEVSFDRSFSSLLELGADPSPLSLASTSPNPLASPRPSSPRRSVVSPTHLCRPSVVPRMAPDPSARSTPLLASSLTTPSSRRWASPARVAMVASVARPPRSS